MNQANHSPDSAQAALKALCESGQRLSRAEGQYFLSEGPPMLVAVRLTFADANILISAQADDTISVQRDGSFTELDDHQVDSLADAAPWCSAIDCSLLWGWTLTNQQGYFDGIQLDFGKQMRTQAQIQMMVIASELHVFQVVK